MESLVPLIIQLASGAAGGNIAGALLKNLSLGTVGNSISGIVGGGIGGFILNAISSGTADSIIGQIAGGGVGGAIVMAIVGFIKQNMGK